MKARVEVGGQWWFADLGQGVPLWIPLRFDGPQPNAFGLPEATAAAFEVPGFFVGDTRQGGSANCVTVTLNPHGNGTHTECVGHIVDERVSVESALGTGLVPAALVSVDLCARADCPDVYNVPGTEADRVISAAALEQALRGVPEPWRRALVIRTRPNGPDKRQRRHSGQDPAYFTLDAMEVVRRSGVEHLLVDLPSVDREEDQGGLRAHRIFWQVVAGERVVAPDAVSRRWTITEMIYVPDDVADGLYVLNLQAAPFVLDAAPSRPVLYPVNDKEDQAP